MMEVGEKLTQSLCSYLQHQHGKNSMHHFSLDNLEKKHDGNEIGMKSKTCYYKWIMMSDVFIIKINDT